MEPWYVALFKKLPLDRKTLGALAPLAGRYGAKGAVVLARSYLGPVACQVEKRHGCEDRKADAPAGAATVVDVAGDNRVEEPPNHGEEQPGHVEETPKEATANLAGLEPAEMAILGMALTKLVYEAGELALHNPTASPEGKHPEFKLDECGAPPALSLSHVVAATRLWQTYSAERADKKQAEAAAEEAKAKAKAPSTPRARLQAARGAQYALTTRYAYVPAPSNNRGPR